MIYGSATVLSILSLLCRASFVYGTLIPTEAKYSIRKLFFTNNGLNKRVLGITACVLVIMSWINTLAYMSVTNEWGPPKEAICASGSMYFPQIVMVIVNLILLYFVIRIVVIKEFDKVGMSFELIGLETTTFTLALVSLSLYGDITSSYVYYICISTLFFALYFPGLMVFYHTKFLKQTLNTLGRRQLNSSRTLLDDKRVMQLCQKFLCEENILFLIRFQEYLDGTLDFDVLCSLFINNGAIFELNISSIRRTGILKSVTKEEKVQNLLLVQKDVIKLLNENIIPYVK